LLLNSQRLLDSRKTRVDALAYVGVLAGMRIQRRVGLLYHIAHLRQHLKHSVAVLAAFGAPFVALGTVVA